MSLALCIPRGVGPRDVNTGSPIKGRPNANPGWTIGPIKMKKLFSYIIIQNLFVAIIIVWTFALSNVTEVQAEDEASTLIFALRKNGINVPDKLDYSKLVQKIQSMQIDVPVSYRENAAKYLDSGKASQLIKIQTIKPGILTWYFHSVIFLKKDLIYAQYDDGEMSGGEILIKVILSENQVTAMKALWNSH